MRDISSGFRWAGVELRHLLTLRAVADAGSLAAAARTLGYSQPAVSQQLQTLERLVGARLVARRPGGRGVTLTEPGQRVLRHGEAILARAQAADADLRAFTEGSAGRLRLGAIPSVGARLVPELLREFAHEWPDVVVELVDDDDDQRLLDAVENGDLDVAFVVLPVRDGPFAVAPFADDPYILAVAADSALASLERVPLKRLADVPLIVCTQSKAPEALLEAHGIAPQIRYRIDANETVAGLAAAGLGAALVPALAIDPARVDLVRLELATPLPPRQIGVVWQPDRQQSVVAQHLINLARRLEADGQPQPKSSATS